MRRFALACILGLLYHISLVDCKGVPVKGSKSENLRQSLSEFSINDKRELRVGPRPVDNETEDGDGGDGNGTTGGSGGDGSGSTGGGGGGDGSGSTGGGDNSGGVDPAPSPTNRPTRLPTLPVPSPTALPTDSPSASPTVATMILAETPAPTDLPSASPSYLGVLRIETVSRSLLPFQITLQGDESELQMVQIPLELAVNEFLSERMEESFESFKEILLSTSELGIMQRQAARKSFGFTGDAKFYDYNAPTTPEVQEVQKRALSDFTFELQQILIDRNVSVNVVDIFVDDPSDKDNNDQDEDKTDEDIGGDESVDSSTGRGGLDPEGTDEPSMSTPLAIGVGAAAAVVLCLCALLLYLQRRKPKIEDNKEPDDPDLDGDAGVDHMIDTGNAAANSQSNAGAYA